MSRYSLEDIEAMLAEDDGEADDGLPDYSGGSEGVAARELRAFIERAEHLAAEKADIAEQEKEVFAEAKGRGYDVKVLKKVIALRKRNRDDIAEEDAILEMYMAALGML
jgi:uncharacterized protein (UPF0335 family)